MVYGILKKKPVNRSPYRKVNWSSSKSLQIVNAGEGVEKREQLLSTSVVAREKIREGFVQEGPFLLNLSPHDAQNEAALQR